MSVRCQELSSVLESPGGHSLVPVPTEAEAVHQPSQASGNAAQVKPAFSVGQQSIPIATLPGDSKGLAHPKHPLILSPTKCILS